MSSRKGVKRDFGLMPGEISSNMIVNLYGYSVSKARAVQKLDGFPKVLRRFGTANIYLRSETDLFFASINKSDVILKQHVPSIKIEVPPKDSWLKGDHLTGASDFYRMLEEGKNEGA